MAQVRLFAVGHALTMAEAETPETYEAAIRATVARDVAPHLASDRANVLVFPESVAFTAAFIGPRGQAARMETTSTAGFTTLLGAYLDQVATYAQLVPGASPGRLLTLSVTDPLWRSFDDTFSGIARDYGVYVVAGIDVGDVEELEDAALIDVLGDPDRPPGAPVYWVPDGRVYNQAVFYGPDGERLGRAHKAHLTDPEAVDLDLVSSLPERLGPIRMGAPGDTSMASSMIRASAMISRDAWMQDALERQVLRGANVLMQNEAFSGGWATMPAAYPWPPDNLQRSGWAAVQKHPELRAAVAPMLVGNFFDIAFDGQSFAVLPGRPDDTPRSLIAQEPSVGWAGIAPWVAEDPMQGSLSERRALLREVSEALMPGGASEGEYLAGTVYVDVDVPADDGYPVVDDARPGAESPVLGASRVIAATGAGRQRYAAPVIAEDGTLVVAWEDTQLCAGQIRVARSSDMGVTWSEPVVVHADARDQRTPSLVSLASGELLVAWQQVVGEDRSEIRMARSSDMGARWSLLSGVAGGAGTPGTVEAWKPFLAVDAEPGAEPDHSNDVYLAFVDRRDDRGDDGISPDDTGNWRVYVARSSDRGATFSEPVRVDPRERAATIPDHTYTNEWYPALAARGGRVLLAYTHRHRPDMAEQPSNEVFTMDSQDRGVTWSDPVRLDSGGFPERTAADISVALDAQGQARVAWTAIRGTAAHTDIAVHDGQDVRLAPDSDPGRHQWYPWIVPAGPAGPADTWIVAWQDQRNGSNDIYVARLTGTDFGPALRVDDAGDSAAESWRPRLAVAADGTVFVVWEDSRSGFAELRVAAGVLP